MNDGDFGVAGLLIGVMLSGFAMLIFCDRIVTPDEIYRAEKICENANSELAWFETNFVEIEVICKSSARFIIGTDASTKFGAKAEAELTQTEVNKNE